MEIQEHRPLHDATGSTERPELQTLHDATSSTVRPQLRTLHDATSSTVRPEVMRFTIGRTRQTLDEGTTRYVRTNIMIQTQERHFDFPHSRYTLATYTVGRPMNIQLCEDIHSLQPACSNQTKQDHFLQWKSTQYWLPA